MTKVYKPAGREKMLSSTKLLLKISRPEFAPANSASLIIGVAWGLTLPVGLLWGLGIPLVMAYSVITLVAAYAAQINTLSDYELDLKDETKRELVNALSQFPRGKLRIIMFMELALSFAILSLLVVIEGKIVMFLLWAAAVFFAHAYSAPPLRLKSRGVFAPVTLLLVLSVLPVSFVAYSFSTNLNYAFWLFLMGQALTVYGVIVPAEIRDYFGDKKMGISTFTVQIGLVKASLFGIALLIVGGSLASAGLILGLAYSAFPLLSVFIAVLAAAYVYILGKYWKLYMLSKKYMYIRLENQNTLENEIVTIAAKNPKWITLITQAIVLMCVVLLVSKLI